MIRTPDRSKVGPRGIQQDRSDLLTTREHDRKELGNPMTTTIPSTRELSGRALAMLRAVHAGRAELTSGREPDLYVDGLPCCDQTATHDLVHAGLLRPTSVVPLGRRVRAELTDEGRAALGTT